MKEFLHNGKKVIYQTVQDESFLDLLNNAGIVPEEVPDEDLSYRVFKYTKDDQKRYACILVANAPDAYVEKVYITYDFPEDGFYNLMLDITGQLGGDDPKMIRSRLSIATEKAEDKAKDWIKEKYPENYMDWFFMGYPEDVQKEYNDMRKLALIHFGYSLETLDQISAPDVDMDYMRDIMK